MRLITWNCNMAFRKKADHILACKPDILIVPECEHPDRLKFNNETPAPTDILWFGDNMHKGLGVFSYSKFRFGLHSNHNRNLKTILPISASNGQYKFNLFAIWANNTSDPDGTYITQVWKAIHHYNKLLNGKKTVLIGDFNSNTIWDKPRREGNHSTVVERLRAKNIHSAYHQFYDMAQGKELHPTLYMYRHKDKPYHIDYCFASADIVDKITDVKVGAYRNWSNFSDHSPLMVTIDI